MDNLTSAGCRCCTHDCHDPILRYIESVTNICKPVAACGAMLGSIDWESIWSISKLAKLGSLIAFYIYLHPLLCTHQLDGNPWTLSIVMVISGLAETRANVWNQLNRAAQRRTSSSVSHGSGYFNACSIWKLKLIEALRSGKFSMVQNKSFLPFWIIYNMNRSFDCLDYAGNQRSIQIKTVVTTVKHCWKRLLSMVTCYKVSTALYFCFRSPHENLNRFKYRSFL